jgi:hypothetical protein
MARRRRKNYGSVRHDWDKAARSKHKVMKLGVQASVARIWSTYNPYRRYHAVACVKAHGKKAARGRENCGVAFGKSPTLAVKGALRNLAKVIK